jgi:hypothetical protein
VGSIPASRTNFFKTNGSESDFWAIFLCRVGQLQASGNPDLTHAAIKPTDFRSLPNGKTSL